MSNAPTYIKHVCEVCDRPFDSDGEVTVLVTVQKYYRRKYTGRIISLRGHRGECAVHALIDLLKEWDEREKYEQRAKADAK